jgi:hypothetical protein
VRIGKPFAINMTAHIALGHVDGRLMGVADLIAHQ